jgi:hypothetical protein
VNFTETLHGRCLGVFGLGLFFFSVISKKRRVTSKGNSDSCGFLGIFF